MLLDLGSKVLRLLPFVRGRENKAFFLYSVISLCWSSAKNHKLVDYDSKVVCNSRAIGVWDWSNFFFVNAMQQRCEDPPCLSQLITSDKVSLQAIEHV